MTGTVSLLADRVGFGTAPLATYFWENDEVTAHAAVKRALERGIRFFDTAPLYGYGQSEARLGAVLTQWPDEPVRVATKVGRLLSVGADGSTEVAFDFSYDATMRSLESSLTRLGIDRVNICHIHDPDDHITDALEGSHRALTELRDQGVIDAVSVGTNEVSTAAAFLDHGDLDCILVAGRYTLLDQSAAMLIDRCADQGVDFLAAGVFNSGVLARPVAGSWYNYAPAPDPVLKQAHKIAAVCARYGLSLRQAAIRFAFERAGVSAVVIGMASPEEVDQNANTLSESTPMDLWQELAAENLVRI